MAPNAKQALSDQEEEASITVIMPANGTTGCLKVGERHWKDRLLSVLLLTVDVPAAGFHELELACNFGEATFIDFVQVHLHSIGKMNIPSST